MPQHHGVWQCVHEYVMCYMFVHAICTCVCVVYVLCMCEYGVYMWSKYCLYIYLCVLHVSICDMCTWVLSKHAGMG